MPIKLITDHELRFVHTICTGVITLDEISHYLQTAWADSELYGYNEIVNYSSADLSKINYPDLAAAAAESIKLFPLDPDSRCALLISTKEHQQMADFYINMKQLLATKSRDIESFRSYDDAVAWITEDHRG